jgi:hypothetical protein
MAIADYLPILAILSLLLAGLLWSLSKMALALDQADLGGFVIWTCVASVCAGLPSWL